MSKTLLITGGHGAFAKKLQQYNTNNKLICLSKQEMDVTNIDEVYKAIKTFTPDILIHVGALTRPMSIHERNPDKSIKNNIIGTSNVVLACIKHNIKIIYISTDFVYPGTEGNYSEKSSIYPVNKYAWSKLGGECAVKLYDNSLILRVAMAQVPYPHPKALVDMRGSFYRVPFAMLESRN